MKILQLSNRIPFPTMDGGAIGIFNIAKGYLDNGAELTHLMIDTPKLQSDIEGYKNVLGSNAKVFSVEIDTSIKLFDALLNLISNKSYHVSRFNSKMFSEKLCFLLDNNEYDLIHIDGPYLADYIPEIRKRSKALVFLRAHNIEHLIWQRIVENESSFLKKHYLKVQTERLKRFEIHCLDKFDGIIAISEIDKNILGQWVNKSKIIISPAGLNFSSYTVENSFLINKTAFLGALDWMPNIQGLNWLLDEVWPKVSLVAPEISLSIAGRNMPTRYVSNVEKNIKSVGEVSNAVSYLTQSGILLIPLLSGSGIRIKLLEAMALGIPIITTRIGAEGIEIENRKHAIIVDNANEFANAIVELSKNIQLQKELTVNAKEFVQQNFENRSVVNKIIDFYQSKING